MSGSFRAQIMSDESSVRIAVTTSASYDAHAARFLHCAKVHRLAARVAEQLSGDKRAARWSVSTGSAPVVSIALGPKGDVRLARDVAAASCVLEEITIDHLTGESAAPATIRDDPPSSGFNPMHLLGAPGTFDDELEPRVQFERIVADGVRQTLTLGVVMETATRSRYIVQVSVGNEVESYRTLDDTAAGLTPSEGRWHPVVTATDETLEQIERAFGGGMYAVTVLPTRRSA